MYWRPKKPLGYILGVPDTDFPISDSRFAKMAIRSFQFVKKKKLQNNIFDHA